MHTTFTDLAHDAPTIQVVQARTVLLLTDLLFLSKD
jgi:hypothetical protein